MSEPIRVLIVEDCVDTADSTAALLRLWGMRPKIARTGKSGLECAAQDPPDVILLDLGLPDMEGQNVARAMRAMTCLDDTMIVVMSGYASRYDQEESWLVGCQEHLAKPVDTNLLRSLLVEGLKDFRNHDSHRLPASKDSEVRPHKPDVKPDGAASPRPARVKS